MRKLDELAASFPSSKFPVTEGEYGVDPTVYATFFIPSTGGQIFYATHYDPGRENLLRETRKWTCLFAFADLRMVVCFVSEHTRWIVVCKEAVNMSVVQCRLMYPHAKRMGFFDIMCIEESLFSLFRVVTLAKSCALRYALCALDE